MQGRFQFGTRALFLGTAIIAGLVWVYSRTCDPLGSAVGGLFGHDTIYSDGYSVRRWRAVKVGMTRAEVHDLLGDPLYSNAASSGKEKWSYSKQRGSHDNWHMRFVIFKEDRVTQVFTYFDVD
jgi:outer membrane protein assembly factor BamE (lipoprotein component of BamABCDE complex)